jgi:hypothetical protein
MACWNGIVGWTSTRFFQRVGGQTQVIHAG